MKTKTYPLAVPTDLLSELRATAKQTGLSVADTMRQSIKLGLPRLRERLTPIDTIKPLSPAESRQAFAPDPEWDGLEAAMAKLPVAL